MSVSPDNPRLSPPPATTPAGLAKLLADAYADVDNLRRELAATKKRAEHAERLNASIQSLRQLNDHDSPSSSKPPPLSQDAALDILRHWEQRAIAAEQARDDADIKRTAIESSWLQLNQYLSQLEAAAVDARAGFARVVENGGPIVAPSHVPVLGSSGRQRGRVFPHPGAFPSLPLPPHPPTTGSRRPRTPSVDGYGHPPVKKARADYDSAQIYPDRPPRMILPPPATHLQPPQHHRPSRSHSRGSSRSSSSSTSVGDMIIQASEGQPNGNGTEPIQPPPGPSQSRRKSRRDDHSRSQIEPPLFGNTPHYDHDQHMRRYPADYSNVVHDYRASPKQAGTVIMTGTVGGGEPLAQPGQAREFQTHIFAPVVTGAPVKKSKFPQTVSSSSAASVSAPPPAPQGETPAQPAPSAAFPATNEQGQRICRQCGMAGRYKEGKCVEKWGPGPMGPGTVCDRCRKKMKRVERRGTLENQQSQLGTSASLSHIQQMSRPQSNTPIHRSDTMPAISHSHFNVSSSRSDIHQCSSRTIPQHSAANANGTPRTLHSPGPAIAAIRDIDEDLPTSAVPRGGAASRSNSRNGIRPSGGTGGRATPVGAGESKKTSPLKHNSTTIVSAKGSSRSPGSGSIMDVDADGDAEDDGDEVEAAFEGLVALGEEASSGRANMEVDGDAGDAEQELLEAVDAAEANSSSSSNIGRLKEED